MRSVPSVFLALMKEWLRSKSGMFFSFLFPLMLLLIFGSVFGGTGSTTYMLHVQNFDVKDGEPTELSKIFIDVLDSMEIFEIKEIDPGIDVNSYVKENPSFEYSYRILKIPKGFEEDIRGKSMAVRLNVVVGTFTYIEENFSNYMSESDLQAIEGGREELSKWKNMFPSSEGAELTFLADETDMSAMAVRSILESIINAFNNQLIGVEEQMMSIKSESLVEKNMSATAYYLPGYIAAFIMTNGIMGATSVISELRRNGTVKRLAATPLPKRSWIMSNVFQQTILAFMLTAVMIIFARIIFGVSALPNLYALLLIFIGAVTFASIGMILGGVIKDVEAASGAGSAIAFPMMFLSGAFWPIEMMPSYMQTIAKCLPLYYFHDGLRNIMILDNLSGSYVPFLVMGTLAVIFIGIAIKITKWKEL